MRDRQALEPAESTHGPAGLSMRAGTLRVTCAARDAAQYFRSIVACG